MRYLLKRHPLPVRAFFRRVLVLTYAVPQDVLVPWLPPGLTLDTYGRLGFLAIAMVQTEGLRPVGLPAVCGRDFFLAGYRVFARYRRMRGLRILRSVTDRRLMRVAGNLLTHYNYRTERVLLMETANRWRVDVGEELSVGADLASIPAELPEGSPFRSVAEARQFAGPLPFTFDYEPETRSIIVIEGRRQQWNPQPVRVEVRRNRFIESFPGVALANAFYLENVPYRWGRGVRYPLEESVP